MVAFARSILLDTLGVCGKRFIAFVVGDTVLAAPIFDVLLLVFPVLVLVLVVLLGVCMLELGPWMLLEWGVAEVCGVVAGRDVGLAVGWLAGCELGCAEGCDYG